MISIYKDKECKTGWRVQASFSIQLNSIDIPLLELLRSFFGTGNIRNYKRGDSAIYSVRSISDLTNIIIPHFNKFPLLTKKQADFELFKRIIELINNSEHLTIEGLNKVLSIRASMN